MEFDFDLENPFSTPTHDFPLLFHIEDDHAPSISYIQSVKSNPSTRSRIVSLILHLCPNFDVFSSYLATNYMDRFLSTTSIPEEKPWILRVIAVSCISLALKMRKIEFSVSDFQENGGVVVDLATIERTEILILGALKWRMRSVNPFSFISFFIPLLEIEDQTAIRALKGRATEIILEAQNDMKLLEFKSSVISGAALLWIASEMFPSQITCFRNSLSSCEYVNEVELSKCYDTMQGRVAPYSVVDLQCCSSSISENKAMSEISEIRDPKRRKCGDFATVSQHIEADVN